MTKPAEAMGLREDDVVPLTDDEVTEFIRDPAKISTHEQALQVIETLDAEIANIQAQIDAYQMEANLRPLPQDRQDWLRRASYAGAMRRNERHKIMQRDKEIRLKGGIRQKEKLPDEAKILKQQRLMAEAEARRDGKKAEALKAQAALQDVAQQRRELENLTSFNHRFVAEAKQQLSPEVYEAIVRAAHARTRGE